MLVMNSYDDGRSGVPRGLQDLSSPTRDGSRALSSEDGVLTTGPPRDVCSYDLTRLLSFGF